MFDYDHLHTAISTLRKKQIFFIGGTIKSGTTWLQLLLNAHPEVSCNGEGHFINNLSLAVKNALDQHCQLITNKNETIFSELAEGYPRLTQEDFLYILASCIAVFLIEQSRKKPTSAIGERTPDNIRHFSELHILFPTAKFVQIIRDGRDCAVSGWFHNLRVSRDWAMQNFGSLEAYASKFARIWASELATAQEFTDGHPDRIRQIRYEDLVTNTERILAGIFEFLGVEASNTVLVHCRAEASFAKLSSGRSPGEENRSSFFRKGVPGDWRNHLSDEANERFRDQAGTWLDRFGYT
jgi:hypothetical protein